ncbi:sugar phosphate isomerase/epimerase [Subtercola sp. PAMC28395]|uniref:sugar phosphate isomerase/epimerase family protein n=1 Tax=Subtercola sp. PAMC28395 TaxID=2846775 RepID=UPI001C0CA3FA|nr:sugar phosphate isomerase/epimerase family protein [Subtercola sp. PAMC28395]QWT24436.1 sugar phosphate isomerase/epimerase [Subtercola sp. PAMC28395]
MPANPIGIHAGLWVGDWSPASATYAISESAKAGFDLIEIPAGDAPNIDVALTAKLLADHGLTGVYSLALPASADINDEDDSVVARGERMLEAAVTLARDTGSRYVGGVTYSKMGQYDHPFTARSRANSQAVLGRVAEKAKAAGVTIGLEFVNRYESNLLNTAQQTVDFIREIGADNLAVHIDTFHVNTEEPDQVTPVRVAGPLLAYIHAGENHRGYLGSGSIDWPALFKALNESNFTGPITFESFSGAVLDPELSHTLGLWRNPWVDPAAVARHAHDFIATQLAAAAATSSFSIAPATELAH